MKRTKRILALLVSFAMVFCNMPNMAIAQANAGATTNSNTQTATFVDMPNNWSTTALSNAVANGLLKGYEEPSGLYIKPSGNLTRAEIASVINRAFGATEITTLDGVTDVDSTSWYATEIAKAVHMKTMSLGTTMRPDEKITRQEAFTVLARAFKAETSDSNYTALNAFADKDSIASWAKESLCALAEEGVIAGINGYVKPTANITRAEFAKLMDNMVKQYVNSPGTFSEVEVSGSVMINVAGVTLSNVTINGDLIIGDGVGSGEVTLDCVKVTGKTIVRGGGLNSIIIKGNSSLAEIIVAKVDGEIRVAVEGSADVEVIVIEDGKDDVIVEGNFETLEVAGDVTVVVQHATVTNVNVTAKNAKLTIAKDATVTNINVLQAAEGSKVTVDGTVTKLTNEAPNTNLSVTGTVKTIEVAITATGTNLDVANGATVSQLDNWATITTSGQGKVLLITGTGTVTTSDGIPSSGSPSSGGSTGGSSSSGSSAYDNSSDDSSSSGSKNNSKFAGGQGTVISPWQIANGVQLDSVRNYLKGHFVLTANIDLSSYTNWTPIGAYVSNDVDTGDYSANLDAAFTGSFNGGGYTIYNLTITREGLSAENMTGTGLFGGIAGDASIQNLKMENATVSSTGSCTGALVGMAMSSNENAIKNITLLGNNSIIGSGSVGGIIGSSQDTNIIDCSAKANVTMSSVGNGAGILGGGIEGGIISGCRATGTVTATQVMNYGGITMGIIGVGGLAGCAFDNQEVINCTAEDVIITVGENAIMVGGLLGYSGVVNEGLFTSDSEGFTLIKGCQVTNAIITAGSGASRIGGIVGSGFCGKNYNSYYPASSAIHLVDCKASGIITADDDAIVGSILGYAFRNCAVVACDGDDMEGTSHQVGAADAAQVVALENVDSVQVTATTTTSMDYSVIFSDNLTEVEVALEFAGGEGTEDSPWQIATAQQLALVQEHLTGHFLLVDDINLAGYGWKPIGAYEPKDAANYDYNANLNYAFTGVFNGGGHTIYNLAIIRDNLGAKDMTGTGLFGGIAGDASIQNVKIEDAKVFSTGSCTGALVGMAMSSNENAIKNITLWGTNSIIGSGSVGGIIGSAQDTNIIDCFAEANVTMTDASNGAGVLGGGIEGGIISGCRATGSVTATATTEITGAIGVGGLVGCAFESQEVINCTAEDVTIKVGTNAIMIGGLIGYSGVVNEGFLTTDAEGFTLIKGCNVINVIIEADAGASRIGGIVGSGFCGNNYSSYYPASSAIHIVDCKASGTITADDNAVVGSILGYAFRNGAVVACDGDHMEGTSNQVGAADAAKAVKLENVD